MPLVGISTGNPRVLEEGWPGGSCCYDLLLGILSNKEKRVQARQLQGNDAQTLVDYLDLVCVKGVVLWLPPSSLN